MSSSKAKNSAVEQVPSREAVETIKRFRNRVTPEGDHLTEHPDGDWVDYSDHEKLIRSLRAEVVALRADKERLNEEIAGLRLF